MANHVLPVLCLLLALGHWSAGNLVLNVTPDTISPGLTSDLTVNCSLNYNNQQNISTIMSLTIFKAESRNNAPGPFSEVLTINSNTNQINNGGNTNANTSGNIDSNTLDAFLSLSWSSPSQAESGFYRCDANVMDEFGQPVDISTLAEVTWSEPELDSLIRIIGTLQANMAQTKTKLDIQAQIITAQNETIAAQNSEMDALNSAINVQNSTFFTIQQELEDQLINKTNQLTDLQTKLNLQTLELQGAFIKSELYTGHFYLIPGILVLHTYLPELVCNMSQGYLAEIEDEPELQFIVKFLQDQLFDHDYIVGAMKDDQSGQWVFRNSGRNVTYFKWAYDQPNDEGNCMYIEGNSREMYDMPCGLRSYGYSSFLCELPQSDIPEI